MIIARFVLQNWIYFAVIGALLFGLCFFIYEMQQTLRPRPGFLRRLEGYWERHGDRYSKALRPILAVACLLWLTLALALATSVFAMQRYWTTQPPQPTWPLLEMSLEVTPAIGTFSENQEVELAVHVVNESDVPVVLESLRLTMPEGAVPDSRRATRRLKESVTLPYYIWYVNVPLEVGADWDVSIPLKFTDPGAHEGKLMAVLRAQRYFEQVLWDVKNVRPKGNATVFREDQVRSFNVPVLWMVQQK